MPAGFTRRDRLRLEAADSPTHADRIEFTCLSVSRPCHGLVVLSPLLSTPHCRDAVTVRYRTILHRSEADSHRSIFLPSQAHCSRKHCFLPLETQLQYHNIHRSTIIASHTVRNTTGIKTGPDKPNRRVKPSACTVGRCEGCESPARLRIFIIRKIAARIVR
jgi:hypothetical protein